MINRLKLEYGYSDTEIKQIKYVLTSLVSESSKIVLIGIVFFFLELFPEYLASLVVLLAVRTNSGGLHFKHYTSCLVFSFVLFFLAIIVLPRVLVLSKLTMLICLLVCIVTSFVFEPVRCIYRPTPSQNLIRTCHINTFKYIFIFLVTTYVLPPNPLITCGFWTIILQMCQLIVANTIKKGGEFFENKKA